MNAPILARHRGRRICPLGGSVTLAVVLCLISSPPVRSQEFEGTVTRNPGSDLVTYTFEFTAPPTIELPVSKIALPVIPDRIAPGSVVSPVGWDAELVVLPGSTFWDYDPLTDPVTPEMVGTTILELAGITTEQRAEMRVLPNGRPIDALL